MSNTAYLDSISPLGKVYALLLLSLCPYRGLLLRQPSSDGTSLLGSEVERQVLLLRIEEAELRSLVGIDDGEDFGNRFAEVVAFVTSILVTPVSKHRDDIEEPTFW